MITAEEIIASGAPCTVIKFNSDGSLGESKSYNMENFEIQQWQIEHLASALLPAIQEFYASEEGQAIAAQLEAERIAKGLPPSSKTPKRRSHRRKRK